MPAGDTVRLTLGGDGERLAELEPAAGDARRSLADKNLTGCRCLLEPRGDVHGIAARERAADTRAPHHELARVHADAQAQSVSEQLLESAAHGESGSQGALRMILEGRRRSEGSHHGVAGELLDRAAGGTDLVRHGLVEAVQKRACVFGVA